MAEPNKDDESTTATTTINDLPVNLLLHILSLLPTLDAIQTTLISRKWRDLWASLSSLSFDYTLFPPYDSPSETLQSFAHFINRTLILRSHSELYSLHLRFDSTPEVPRYKFHIDSWIRYAIDHNANSLHLDFYSKYIRRFDDPQNDIVYAFPFAALKNSSVRALFLHRYNLTPPIHLSRSMQFETLRSMHLEQIYLTDEMVSNLISGCVNLEHLVIMRCYGMKDVKISSSKLTELGLWTFTCDEGSVEISAPNLRKLNILFFEVGKYVLEDALSLVEANVCFFHKAVNYGYWSKVMRLFGHVERLSIQNWGFKVVAANDLFSESFLFYNLNYLELRTDYSKSDLLGMAALLERSPKLETMILERNLKLDEENFEERVSEEFNRIKFSLPSLMQLKMNCYWGVEDDLCFLKLVLNNEVVLERIVLFPIRMDGTLLPPIVLVKQPQAQGFQILQGFFPEYRKLVNMSDE